MTPKLARDNPLYHVAVPPWRQDEAGWRAMDAFVGVVLLFPLALCYAGVTVQSLWGWFVTPALRYRAPSVSVCAGLFLLAWALTHSDTQGVKWRSLKDVPSFVELVIVAMLKLSLVLALGYLTQLFV